MILLFKNIKHNLFELRGRNFNADKLIKNVSETTLHFFYRVTLCYKFTRYSSEILQTSKAWNLFLLLNFN